MARFLHFEVHEALTKEKHADDKSDFLSDLQR